MSYFWKVVTFAMCIAYLNGPSVMYSAVTALAVVLGIVVVGRMVLYVVTS